MNMLVGENFVVSNFDEVQCKNLKVCKRKIKHLSIKIADIIRKRHNKKVLPL